MSTDTLYFAAKPADQTVEILMSKSEQWFKNLDVSGYFDKLKNSWASYHGAYYQDSGESHQVSFGGEQGELTQIGVNHYRNIAQHMLNMITSTRPAMQARSINTDQKSTVQTALANGLLDYYMRDHRLEEYIKVAAEYGIVLGSGYIKVEWNSLKGEIYDFNEELGIEIREGDIEFTNLSPFDVLFDTTREDRKHDWVITRGFKNRFDIAAKYPELRDKILALPTKSELYKYTGFSFTYDETDLIPVYEFYHKRTESMPDGRYLLYLDVGVTLLDSPMPYRNLPVYCIAPAYYLGTPYAYTPMFDLLGLQDSVNSLYSTILSNQTAFGVQNIVIPKSADISISQISGGLNIIEANDKDGQIRPLNLTNTPKEIFDFMQILEKAMETVSGVNAVSRGNPDPNLRSGNALALVQAQTLQFLSGLQQSYVSLVEDLGTGIINILKDHANVPRIATIVGKNKRTYLKEFTGDQLDTVNRVVVDIGNPLAKTTAGRVEMAEQLLQMGLLDNAKQYISVIETGNLDNMTEDTFAQLNLVRGENERLVENDPVVAVFTDDHLLHIKEHSNVLADPDLRLDGALVDRVTSHIQEHINLLRSTDPDLLRILGQEPLGPQGGGQSGAPAAPPANSMQGAPQETMGGPAVNGQLAPADPLAQASQPSLPDVPANLLPNPELQAQSLGNVEGV